MKIFILSLMLAGITACGYAQNEIDFKLEYQPETQYTLNSVNTMNMVSSSVDASNSYNSSSSKKNTSKKMELVISNGKLDGSSHFPVALQMRSYSTNGQNILPGGLVVYGYASPGAMPKFDSVAGTDMTDAMKSTVLTTMQNIISQLSFPHSKVKVGREITQKTPLSMPLIGIPVEMYITTHYKLIKIEDGIAHFNVKQEISMNSSASSLLLKMSATGKGKGTMDYDIAHNFYTSLNLLSKMDMTGTTGSVTVDVKVEQQNSETVTIAHIDSINLIQYQYHDTASSGASLLSKFPWMSNWNNGKSISSVTTTTSTYDSKTGLTTSSTSTYDPKTGLTTSSTSTDDSKTGGTFLDKVNRNLLEMYTKKINDNPRDAEAYMNRGYLAKDPLHDYKGAIADLDTAIEIWPDSAKVYSYQGAIKIHAHDYQGAVDDYTKAITLQPEEDYYYSQRSDAKRHLNDYQGAITDCTKAISLNPTNASAYGNRGAAKVLLQDYTGALDDLNIALKSQHRRAFDYKNRGDAQTGLKNYNAAVQDYATALSLDSNFSWAYYSRGRMQNILKHHRQAIKDLNEAIHLNPDAPEFYIERANAEIGLKKYEEAINDLTRFINANPKIALAYVLRAGAKYGLNDFRSAIDDYNEAISLDTNNLHAYFGRAEANYSLKNYDAAIQDHTRAIKINPEYIGAYSNRGSIKQEMGDYNGALEDFTKVIQLDSANKYGYYNIGLLKYSMQDYKAATNYFDTALILDSTFVGAQATRGMAKYNMKQYTEAISDLKKCIHEKPDYTYALINLAEVYRTGLKQTDSARFYCRLALNSAPENANNEIGYTFIDDKQYDSAAYYFKLNINQFPASANCYDSYGDLLSETGDTTQAIEYYNKAISHDTTFIESYKKLVKLYQKTGDTAAAQKMQEVVSKLEKAVKPSGSQE